MSRNNVTASSPKIDPLSVGVQIGKAGRKVHHAFGELGVDRDGDLCLVCYGFPTVQKMATCRVVAFWDLVPDKHRSQRQ